MTVQKVVITGRHEDTTHEFDTANLVWGKQAHWETELSEDGETLNIRLVIDEEETS